MHIVGLLITCLGAHKQKIACVHARQLVFLKNVMPLAAENVFHKKRHHNRRIANNGLGAADWPIKK